MPETRPRIRRCLIAASMLFSATVVHAQTPAVAATPIPLWPNGAPGALGTTDEDVPSVTMYKPEAGRANGTGALIFPGGGYVRLAVEKEGIQAARWLNDLGVTAFVVRYRLGPRYHYPAMLADARRAMRFVRAHASEWHLDQHRIGVIGFSAGGHMASLAGTHIDPGNPRSEDPVERVSSRPDFMILAYPVITMDERFAHRGSRENLLGANPPADLVRAMSNETQVTAATPPTFIVASTDDSSVPVANSLLFYEALHAAGIPAELHIYESGRHGFGLAPDNPTLATWVALCTTWMRGHGWLGGQ